MYCSLSIKYWWWRTESTSLSQNGSVYPWNLSSHWKSGDAVGSPLIAVWIMGWTCAARFSFGNWWMKCAVFCLSCENRWVRQFPVMKGHSTFPGTNLSSPVSSEFHWRSMEMAKRTLDTSSSKNNLKKSRQKTTSTSIAAARGSACDRKN